MWTFFSRSNRQQTSSGKFNSIIYAFSAVQPPYLSLKEDTSTSNAHSKMRLSIVLNIPKKRYYYYVYPSKYHPGQGSLDPLSSMYHNLLARLHNMEFQVPNHTKCVCI